MRSWKKRATGGNLRNDDMVGDILEEQGQLPI